MRPFLLIVNKKMELVLRFILWFVYLISLYFVVFWFLVFLDDKKDEKKKKRSDTPFVTIAIPCLNEESHLRATVETALSLDYPKNRFEIFIVDNGSTDNTAGVAQKIINDYPDFMIQLFVLKEKGKGLAMNKALRHAQGEYYVCFDVDSFVKPDSLRILLNHFDDADGQLAAVLPCMKVYKPQNLLEKAQYCEYVVNMYYKWLMSHLDCVHVAPGPFTVYRTEILKKIGGFAEDSIVEDMEITYRLQSYHYKIRQVMDAQVFTQVPSHFKAWYWQRNRWFKGTIFTSLKYKRLLFNKKYGDFGMLQLPTVVLSGPIAVVMLLLTAYYSSKNHVKYLMNLRYVGFDFMTFVKHFGFNFNLLDLNMAAVVLSVVMLVMTVIILRKAYQETREWIFTHGYGSVLFFMTFYFLCNGIAWLGVSLDLLRRKKVQQW